MNSLKANNKIPLTLVGKNIKVISSSDPSQKGLTGNVSYETRNMLTIKKRDRSIKIQKKSIKISLKEKDNRNLIIKGIDLVGKPEDRAKKLMRRIKSNEKHRH